MIRIFKDNDVKLVTNGVYNSLYKPLGYKPIIEVKEEPKKEPVVVQPKKEEVKPEQIKESSKPKKTGGK